MSYKILPQVILKTIKEYRNVLTTKNSMRNQDDTQTLVVGKCVSRENKQHSKSESNDTNNKKTSQFLTLCVIPVILAIHGECEKPPLMKYTELPLYDRPHSKYNEHQEEENKCYDDQPHKLHNLIYPYVKLYRCLITYILENIFEQVKCQVLNTNEGFKIRINKCISYMRDDENLYLRTVFTAVGSAAGFLFGFRDYILRNIVFGVLAASFTGWLCFPNETDRIIRDSSFCVASTVVDFINLVWGNDRDIIKLNKWNALSPCSRDLCKLTDDSEECFNERSSNLQEQIEEDLLTIKRLGKQKKVLEEQFKEELEREGRKQ